MSVAGFIGYAVTISRAGAGAQDGTEAGRLVVEHLMALVRRLRDDLGLAVLLVEQNAGAALEIADHGYVMEHGRIVYDAPARDLVAHAGVREFYLGLGERAHRKRYTEVKQYRSRRRWL